MRTDPLDAASRHPTTGQGKGSGPYNHRPAANARVCLTVALYHSQQAPAVHCVAVPWDSHDPGTDNLFAAQAMA